MRRFFCVVVVLVLTAVCSLALSACGQGSGADGYIGMQCSADDDCTYGCFSDWPGGYCTLGCTDDRTCPGDSVCVDIGDRKICIQPCTEEYQCRDGYTCWQGACVPDGFPGADGDMADGDQVDGDTDFDFEITPPELPRLTDWECPPEWRSVPAFVDENGNEDVPEGMQQYHICEPPEYWSGPSGPVKLKSWECPVGWVPVVHETLTDEFGLPFSWCEPPKLARLFVPGGNDDGTDYLTPLSEGESPADYQTCDLSKGMMPELWGTGCIHIGDPCPAGDFPTIPAEVTGKRVYVKAGSTGGSGSIGNPWGTIRDAIVNSVEGDVIVLGPGTYIERVSPTTSRTIWGACVEKVTINGPVGGPVVRVSSWLELRNVRVTGTGTGVETPAATSHVTLAGVTIDRTQRAGMNFQGGTAILSDVVVFGTRSDTGQFGRGLNAQNAVNVIMERGVFERNRELGIFAFNADTVVALNDVVVRETQAVEGGPFAGSAGRGVHVQEAARMTVERGLLERNREAGISAMNAATAVILTDIVVRETQVVEGGSAAGTAGRGLEVLDAASVAVDRGVFQRNRDVGILASLADTTVTLTDVAVRDTQAAEVGQTNGVSGQGLHVQQAAQVTVDRGIFEWNRYVGILCKDSGTFAVLTDIVVQDTQGVESGSMIGEFGTGLNAESSANVAVTRGVFERNRSGGLFAADEGTHISLTDIVVRDTQPVEGGPEAGEFGRGIAIQWAARATVDRGIFERNHELGLNVLGADTSVTLTDIIVRDTQPTEGGIWAGKFGQGLHVQQGSRVTVKQGLFDQNKEIGIALLDAGTEVTLTDIVVRKTKAVAEGPFAGSAGRGMEVVDEARVTVERGLFERSREVGIYAAGEDTIASLTDTVIRETMAVEGGPKTGSGGRGLNAQDSARVTLERGLLERNREVGIAAFNTTIVNLIDIAARETFIAPCALLNDGDPFRCIPNGMQGVASGLAAILDARVHATRFAIQDNAILGVQIARAGIVALSDGVVFNHAIGVNIQIEGYDLSSLQDNVVWNNQRNIAYEDLPIPDPAEILADITDPVTKSQSTVPDLLLPLPARPLPMRPQPRMMPLRSAELRSVDAAEGR